MVFSLFERAHEPHTRKRKIEKNLIVKEKNILFFQLLFNCNTEKTKIIIFYNSAS